jgi:hypothetical protein
VLGAMWDRSRLDEFVRRAAAWLEAQGKDGGDGTLSSAPFKGGAILNQDR